MVSTETAWLPEPYEPQETTDVERAFPASVRRLMPDPATIPAEYRRIMTNEKWERFWADRFYRGLAGLELTPREGIDAETAWGHLECICGSFEPKHEHKLAALWFLSERWFSDVKWKAAK